MIETILVIAAGVALGILATEAIDALIFVYLYNRIKRWLDATT